MLDIYLSNYVCPAVVLLDLIKPPNTIWVEDIYTQPTCKSWLLVSHSTRNFSLEFSYSPWGQNCPHFVQ